MHRTGLTALAFLFLTSFAHAQTATLREIRAEGMKTLTEPQVATLSQLTSGSQVGKPDLQSAADNLVKTGLFSKVSYNFKTQPEGVTLIFHVEEAPRVPAYFDNIPWFAESELTEAIRKKLPFYDGHLPEGGNVVEQAAQAVEELVASRGLGVKLEHQLAANPLGDGNVQQFRIEGASLKIAKIDFSDATLGSSHVIQQHLSEIIGKPYSRMTIDLFLSEQVRPIFIQQGYLRAKLGPPEVRLTGNPNQKLPEQIPVFIPVSAGSVYRWKDAQWSGNILLSTITLTQQVGLRAGDVVDGMQTEAAWDKIREEYAHRGYVDARVDPVPAYDDAAHTVTYSVKIEEGAQYKFSSLVITGLSVAAERHVREAWTVKPGEVFDKKTFEDFLTKLQTHPEQVFKDIPVHFENIGHWLQNDTSKKTVEVLLDFK